MLEDKKILIIGLGLIGGSLAKALKLRLQVKEIIGVSDNISEIQESVEDGIISFGMNELDERIYDVDIVFICTPVKVALKYLEMLNGKLRNSCIVSDVCSTKVEILNEVNLKNYNYRFVGGHPMAGSEASGYKASKEHLFENAYYILTKSCNTDENAYETILNIIQGIGAIALDLEENEHDYIMANISHFPHVLASTLVNMIRSQDEIYPKMKMLAAGGFRDITRIASSNGVMWSSIIFSNKEIILKIIKEFRSKLKEFENSVSNMDFKGVTEHFEKSKKFRDSMFIGRQKTSESTFEIYVDVIDEPGVIGKIATLLGNNGINIKNINVLNSREFEKACLLIALRDLESLKKAKMIIENDGKKVYTNT